MTTPLFSTADLRDLASAALRRIKRHGFLHHSIELDGSHMYAAVIRRKTYAGLDLDEREALMAFLNQIYPILK